MEKKKLNLKEIGLPKLIVICLCGMLLIFLSVPDMAALTGGGGKKEEPVLSGTSTGKAEAAEESYESQMEEKLKAALEKVQGVGKVEVVITLKGSGEQVTLKDSPYKQDNTTELDGSGGSRTNSSVDKGEETVLVKSEEGDSVPYIIKELEPEVEGVLVIAQGGGNPSIINEINSAIEVLFNIPVHKIKVMKMVDEGKAVLSTDRTAPDKEAE